MNLTDFQSAPTSETHRRINYNSATVVPGGAPGTYFLHVTGEAPCLNMEVRLVPLIYIRCPEYWVIEVIGYLPGGVCLTATRQYTVCIPLAGVTGSTGIEVVGASKNERIQVSGGNCSANTSFAG